MNASFTSLLAVLCFWFGPGLAATPEPERPEVAVAAMSEWNVGQLALGFLGIRKGGSEPVRSYARLLVDDAVRFEKELMDLARQKGAQTVSALAGFQRPAEAAALENLPASAFDEAFLKAAREAAERTRTALHKLGENPDADYRAFAQRALGDLEWRLALAPGADGKRATPPPIGEEPKEM